MADTEYSIEVQAEGIGTESTAAEILALDDAMTAADKVVTRFDSALERTGALLAEAGTAAERANGALDEARAKYNSLEKASIRAGKAVERAAAKGKDTTALQAAADAAAAAVLEQAAAVDRAAAEATSAAAAQDKLARAYKNLEKRADRAAEASRGTKKSFGELFGAAGALGGPLGGLAGQISGIGDGLRGGGGKAGVILATFAAGNAFIIAAKAAVAFGVAIGAAVVGLLAYAVAADEATTKKLGKAWEDAGKNAKKLFEGVKTDKLVKPAQSLLQLLDGSTSAGKGLSKLFETILNPIIDGLVKAEPLAKEFFKGMILGALRATIFVLKLRNSVAKAIPKETREKIKKLVASIFSLENAAKAGEEAFNLWFLPFKMFIVLGTEAGLKALWLAETLDEAFSDLSSDDVEAWLLGITNSIIDWGEDAASAIDDALNGWPSKGLEAAKELGQGIIDGIVEIAGNVAKAASDMADGAVKAIKKTLKIKSPSRVMFRMFKDDVGGAAAMGLEASESDVRQGASKLGTATMEGATQLPPPGTPSATPGGRGNGQATVTLTLESGAIVISAPTGDAGDLAREVRRVLLAEVDGAALQLGAGELATGTT
jgi:hypothetical protein